MLTGAIKLGRLNLALQQALQDERERYEQLLQERNLLAVQLAAANEQVADLQALVSSMNASNYGMRG